MEIPGYRYSLAQPAVSISGRSQDILLRGVGVEPGESLMSQLVGRRRRMVLRLTPHG
jgi:hypothetical protein